MHARKRARPSVAVTPTNIPTGTTDFHSPSPQLTWKTQETVALAALFVALALQPATVLNSAAHELCFTSSERQLDNGKWVLADFDDYMMSRCPTPPSDYGDLYANATAGQW